MAMLDQGLGQPLDALLADYAAGRLSPNLHALMEAHLVLSGQHRGYVHALEAAVAEDVVAAPPIALPRRAAILERIMSEQAAPARPAAPLPPDVLPSPLRRIIGHDLADVPWRSVMPGLKEFSVPSREGEEANLLWIKAGRRMPAHTHEGSEVTLVLKGAFRDVTGRYGRGDIAVADGELDHRPTAEEGEDCICFAVTDAPLRLTGPVGRILQRFLRH